MPGNPRECRQHALNCALLAKEASTAQSKQLFHDLARSGLGLLPNSKMRRTY
jgi:hypothetical protein